MKKSEGAKIIKEVARNRGVTVAEVRREMELAIDAAMSNPDPAVRAHWETYGRKPTPEEFIVDVAKRILEDMGRKE
jgi:hypothetical protein